MALNLTVTVKNGIEVVGRLQIMSEAARVFGGSRASVYSNLNYAHFVVDGTRPHTIYPRGEHSVIATHELVAAHRALFWPGAVHPVAVVHHPGTKANPFMQDALTAVGSQAEEAIASAAETIASGGGDANTLKKALNTAGLLVQAEIMRRAPTGKTGNLRQSFHTELA